MGLSQNSLPTYERFKAQFEHQIVCNNSSPSLTRADLLHHDVFSYLNANGSEEDFLTINF